MASERWKVVGETRCYARLQQVTELETKNFSCTKFLMDIKATVRRCLHQEPLSFYDESGVSLFAEEDNWSVEANETEIEIQTFNPYDMATAISQALSNPLQVPVKAHEHMLDTIILPQAFEAARTSDCYAAPKVVHIAVEVDVFVVEKDCVVDDFGAADFVDVEDDQPAFVPASKEVIEKLERTKVEVSTMCSVCMDEIKMGAEATQLPCLHVYHGGCIVEWLQKSRVCPLCRYSMPSDE